MRIPLIALFLAVAPPTASAQLVYVEFKNDKIAKRYSDNLTTFKGRRVVIGEPKAGITAEEGKVNYTGGAEAKNAIWVGNPAKPDWCPYKLDRDGEKSSNGKKGDISFAGDDINRISYVDRLQTLQGLSDEYERRSDEIDAIKDARDEFKKGDRDWFNKHGLMIGRLDALTNWLTNVGYEKAAKSLERKVDKERKVIAKEATAIREQQAINSVEQVEPSEALVKAADEYADGRKYGVVESQHIRITYIDDLPDVQARRMIELGERVIESFRKEFVDPYLGEDFVESIPDSRFVEFYFGSPELGPHEKMFVNYYGGRWNMPLERSLKSAGTSTRFAGMYIRYWKLDKDVDLEGAVTHSLGHVLCDLHFNGGRGRGQHDWLAEAVGYYVSFGFLGRNSVTCFAYSEKKYAAPAAKEGEKTVQSGLRGYFNELARTQGPTLEAMAVKSLAEITDADFAKAWSFFDWIATTQGKLGQKWLRSTCLDSSDRSSFITRWRATSEKAFETEPGTDVFSEIDRRWRKFAERDQSRE